MALLGAPSRTPRPRSPKPRLIAGWLAFAMGCSSAQPATPELEDSTLPPVADDSCARFGFGFDAAGCSEAECALPLCTCPSLIECIPGKNQRCMVLVDCSVACSAYPQTLLACAIDIAPCRTDGDCREGLCVVEPGSIDGECESGERGARCRNDRDCRVGNCVAGEGGNRACSPGQADDLCNRASDCRSLRCRLTSDTPVGVCED